MDSMKNINGNGDPVKKPMKKRKYSRGGCEECKRRKMKCDEGKPFCYNCTKLNKSCIFKTKEKYKFGPIGERDNRKDVKQQISSDFKNGSHKSSPNIKYKRKNSHEASILSSNGQHKPDNSVSYRHYLPPNNGGYLNNFVSDQKFNPHLLSPTFPNIPGSSPSLIGHSFSNTNMGVDIDESSKRRHDNGNESISNVSSPNINTNYLDNISHRSATVAANATQVTSLNYGKPSFTNAISDILTPNDSSNDYIVNQNDFIDIKNLFDEASLLVSDMNDLVAMDLLSFGNGNEKHKDRSLSFDGNLTDQSLANPLVENKLKKLSETPTAIPTSGSLGSVTGSEGVKSTDTFEKHNFRADEFSRGINEKSNNGNYLSDYALNSPQVGNVNHLNDSSIISNFELVDELIKHHNLTEPHSSYLKFINDHRLSASIFPFASSVESNEVAHLLLKYSNNCSYLISSLLAMSATIQYNTTGKKVHEMSSQKYVSVCLKSLSQAFANSSPSRVHEFLNDIERLLLTVLVLTSIFSSTKSTNKDDILNGWKTHLRGAKDLLVNYSSVTKNQQRLSISGGLALARTWFFAIEALAGLTTTSGGTLTRNKPKKLEKSPSVGILSNDTDDDCNDNNIKVFSDTGYFNLESNPEYNKTLLNIGLLTSPNNKDSSEFNLFVGFTMELVFLIQELTKALDFLRSREDNIQLSPLKITKLLSLVYNAQKAIIAPLVNRTNYIIPKQSPAHPDFPKSDPNRVELPESAYTKAYTEDNTVIYYSWYDISQQIHADALYLRIVLTPGIMKLPKNHPLIQELVKRVFNGLFFVRPKNSQDYKRYKDQILVETDHYFLCEDLFDTRAYMIQSSCRIVTNLVHDDDDLEKLELFFMGLVKLGNGSALLALESVEIRKSKLRSSHHNRDQDDEDELLLVQTETVPFT